MEENLWIIRCVVFALYALFMCTCADFITDAVTTIRICYELKKKLKKEGTWTQIGYKVYKLVKNARIEEV